MLVFFVSDDTWHIPCSVVVLSSHLCALVTALRISTMFFFPQWISMSHSGTAACIHQKLYLSSDKENGGEKDKYSRQLHVCPSCTKMTHIAVLLLMACFAQIYLSSLWYSNDEIPPVSYVNSESLFLDPLTSFWIPLIFRFDTVIADALSVS